MSRDDSDRLAGDLDQLAKGKPQAPGMRRQPSTGDDDNVGGSPKGLARSSSGVWWKLMGDAAGFDASEVDRQLRGIADEEAAVRARIERRHAGAPAFRRKTAVASMGLEVVALLWYGLSLWRARRRGSGSGRAPTTTTRTRPLLPLLPALAVPALATVALAAFGRFRNMLDRRDEQQLERLRAERKAKIGSFRGSHHNLQKLIQKYHPDDDDAGGDSSKTKKLKRTHSRLGFQYFHVGEEGGE